MGEKGPLRSERASAAPAKRCLEQSTASGVEVLDYAAKLEAELHEMRSEVKSLNLSIGTILTRLEGIDDFLTSLNGTDEDDVEMKASHID